MEILLVLHATAKKKGLRVSNFTLAHFHLFLDQNYPTEQNSPFHRHTATHTKMRLGHWLTWLTAQALQFTLYPVTLRFSVVIILIMNVGLHPQHSDKNGQVDPEHLLPLVLEIVPDNSCLLFCPTKRHCENVALMLARLMRQHHRWAVPAHPSWVIIIIIVYIYHAHQCPEHSHDTC